MDKDEFNAHLGPYNDVATANSIGKFPNAQDDIFLSAIASNRSSGKNTGVGLLLVLFIHQSTQIHFFHLVAGHTHKENSNTQNDITGTQLQTLTANDIYAGIYTQVDTGVQLTPQYKDPQKIFVILYEMI